MYPSAPLYFHIAQHLTYSKVVCHNKNGNLDTVTTTSKENEVLFSEETIISIIGLGQTLRKIRARLLNDGYKIKDGKIVSKKKYEK